MAVGAPLKRRRAYEGWRGVRKRPKHIANRLRQPPLGLFQRLHESILTNAK